MTACEASNDHISLISKTSKATFNNAGKIVKTCNECGYVSSTSIPQVTSVRLSATRYAYNGEAKKPEVILKDSNGNEIDNDYYSVSYYDAVSNKKVTPASIGKYYAKVTLKGKYSGSKNLYFTIGPKNTSSVKATLYGYDDVQVTWSKVSGASGYEVKYRISGGSWTTKTTTGTSMKLANLSDGKKYEIKVSAYKNVSGNKCYNSGKMTSIYTQIRLSDCTVQLSKTVYGYDGKVKTPSVIVKYGNKVLVKDKDYSVTYPSGRKNVGTYSVKVTGKGLYTGTVNKTFKIKYAIANATVTLSKTQYTYDGKVKTPSVTVKYGSKVLVEDKDYTVTYLSGRKNEGSYTVKVIGKGSYTGTKEITFKIICPLSNTTVTLSQTSYAYDGKMKTPSAIVIRGSKVLKEGTDYTVTYPSGRVAVGSYSVKITGKGIYSGSVEKTFKIKYALADASVTLSNTSYIYDGEVKIPTVAVQYGSQMLIEGQDYDVVYLDESEGIGIRGIQVTGKGNYAGTVELSYEIRMPEYPDIYVYVPEDYYMGAKAIPCVVINEGNKPIRIYSKNAILTDPTMENYLINLTLLDLDTLYDGRNEPVDWVEILPGDEQLCVFECDMAALYDVTCELTFEFEYDTVMYEHTASDSFSTYRPIND